MPQFLLSKLPLFTTLGLISLITGLMAWQMLQGQAADMPILVEGMPEELEKKMLRVIGGFYAVLAAAFPVMLLCIAAGLSIGDHLLLPIWGGCAVVVCVATLLVRHHFCRRMEQNATENRPE